VLAFLPAPGAALAAPADPYVVYTANSFAGGAVVLRTDPAAGSLVEISRNGAQGTLFRRPFDLALEADGDLLVADMGAPCTTDLRRCPSDGRVIRVDTITGRQTLVASGAPLLDPAGIAVAPNGDIYVADNHGADDDGAVIRIDPVTGAQTLVTEGDQLDLPFGILVDRDGSLVVSNRMAPGSACSGTPGRLVRVQQSGDQQVVSEGGLFKYPLGLALDALGRIAFANECGPNGLLRVLGAATQSPITSNNDTDLLVTPERLALDPAGDFLVSDFSVGDGDGGIVKVGSSDGAQSLVRQGELFNHPLGIAAVVNRPPSASLRVVPSIVAAGRPVRMDASGSRDPEGLRLVYEWDLNGDGVFEAGTGTRARASRTWRVDGTVSIGMRVNDPHGGRAVATGVMTVDGSVPVVSGLRADSRVLGVGRRWRGRSGAAAAQSRRPGPPRSTRLRFGLSEPAVVRVAAKRVRAGRRAHSGAPCRPRAKRGRPCIHRSQVRALRKAGRPGANSLRIRSRGLAPGSYRLVVTATDAVDHRSTPRVLGLRVVRLPR
jgi:hypothetical protein